MSRTLLFATLAATVLGGSATSSEAAGKPDRTLTLAAKSLGAAETSSLEFSATGSWYQFGQAPAPGQQWPQFSVSSYRSGIDFNASAARVQITRAQVVEPGRVRPAPVEQKVDQYVAGETAWNVPANASTGTAPTAQPAAVEERRAEIWSTPQGFVKLALASDARVERKSGVTRVAFTTDGKYRYEGELNAAGEVTRVRTWIDNPVLGDTLLETGFSDYQTFGALRFPRHIVRRLGGHPVLELNVSDVRVNGVSLTAAPANLAAAPAPEVKVTKLDEGVYYLTGGTHHSVLVEQDDHLVIVEAPQNEARSLAVIAKAKETVPGKPIRYLVNTHAHFDHSGGLRTYVDEGALIVTDSGNRPFYEQAWAAPRTLKPDRLAKSGKQARFETFTGKHVLAGRHPIEVHAITGSGHNDAFSLVYLPGEKILIEADAYTPGPAGSPAPASPNPYTVNLADNLKRLGLEVGQIAALHGPRVATYEDLRTATGVVRAPAPTTSGVVKTDIAGVVKAGNPIELVKQGFDGTEGPLPLPDGSLVFTENRVDRIQRIADDGSTAVFLERSGNPNALARGLDGTILAAQTGKPGIGVIYPADKARVLADSFQGRPFNRPNDLIVDRAGGVYFTDPGPGPAQRQPGVAAPASPPIPAVYYLSPRGQLEQLATDIARPNGVALSPDEKTLYVANTYGEHVLAYDVAKDGSISRRRDFARLAGFRQTDNGPSSGADGLAVDTQGRLYVASSAGIEVFDRKGRALGVIEIPNAPQNLAFAGADRRTLYVVGRGAVWKIRTQSEGPAGRGK
jgi:sugar lactone lactonase YvrE/glyoxylase-like metal-dependent hydrolase (beta-lactamase superfamily II)